MPTDKYIGHYFLESIREDSNELPVKIKINGSPYNAVLIFDEKEEGVHDVHTRLFTLNHHTQSL